MLNLFNSTKRTLQKSLIALSSSNTVHYETTAAEIAATRFALLKLDGVEINKTEQAEYLAQAKIKQLAEKEINSLIEIRARLEKQIAELELQLLEMQSAQPIDQ